MYQPRFWCLILSVALPLTLPSLLHSQSGSSAAPSQRQDSKIVTLTECEGVDNCAIWTFIGGQGSGHWRTGQYANLMITSGKTIDAKSWAITIHRVDVTGTAQGYVADYEGTVENGRIGGKFKSSWKGKEDAGNWYALPGAPINPPTSFHACAAGNCLTYTLENGQYKNYTNLPYQQNEVRTITVKTFERDSIVFDQTDTGSYPLTAIWKGNVTNDESDTAEGVLQFTSWAGKPVQNGKLIPFRLTWGAAIDAQPGSGQGGPNGAQAAQGEAWTNDQKLKGGELFLGTFQLLWEIARASNASN